MVQRELTDAEYDALELLLSGGYLLAHAMYIHGFRRRVRFSDGTVGTGRNTTVSVNWFRDMLERQGKPGSHWQGKALTRDRVKTQVKALERVGLIRRLDKPNPRSPLRYELPLASLASIRFQEEHPHEHPQENLVKHCNSTKKVDKSAEEHPEEHPITYIQQQHGADAVENAKMVMRVYNATVGDLFPPVRRVTSSLVAKVAVIWKEDEQHRTEEFWAFYFGSLCRKSDFLTGKDYKPRLGKFKANLSFLLKLETFEKVLNEDYS